MKRIALLIAAVLVIGSVGFFSAGSFSLSGLFIQPDPPEAEEAMVIDVIQGDIVVLEDESRVRLLGISAPKEEQPYYDQSRERLKELVLGQTVLIERDELDTGQSGYHLRHLFVDGRHINRMLVEEGLVTTYFLSPNLKYLDTFTSLQIDAKENGRGLWSIANSGSCIIISSFQYNPQGSAKNDLNSEYVKFRNTCSYPIVLTDWTLRDGSTNTYWFSDFVLSQNSEVSLFSGNGHDTTEQLYWGSSESIWDIDGDTLYLRDQNGQLVLSYTY